MSIMSIWSWSCVRGTVDSNAVFETWMRMQLTLIGMYTGTLVQNTSEIVRLQLTL